MVREPDATMQPAPQDNQLMAKDRVLSFKPHRRLEWRGQDGHNEKEQPNHSASLGDSITSSTRIRFSVHTGPHRRHWSGDNKVRYFTTLSLARRLTSNASDGQSGFSKATPATLPSRQMILQLCMVRKLSKLKSTVSGNSSI